MDHRYVLTYWDGQAWRDLELTLSEPLKVGKEARRRHAGKWISLSRDQVEEVTTVLAKTGSYTIVPILEWNRLREERELLGAARQE